MAVPFENRMAGPRSAPRGGCHLISLKVSGGIPRVGSWRRSCEQRGARHEGVERCQSLSAKTILLHQ